jgi:hypothetical protein
MLDTIENNLNFFRICIRKTIGRIKLRKRNKNELLEGISNSESTFGSNL